MSGPGGGLEAAWYRGDAWLWLLRPIEFLFRTLASLRRLAYGSGLARAYRADTPVVVIGNITVGGTGKTPVVIALVEALQGVGLRPGVVSRGYGASMPLDEYPHLVGSDSSAEQCGDEPLLIHRRTGAPVAVAPQRPAAVRCLLRSGDIDIVLSDDGLQHYALARDMEVVVIDAQRQLGNGFCLPAGPLREPKSRLASVDHVLYRNGDDPRTAVRYVPDCWVNLADGQQRPLDAFAGAANVIGLAGIGQPAQFFATLRKLGVDAQCLEFPDHHIYSDEDFAGLTGRSILMTEKDAVKCTALAGPGAWYLRIGARLPDALVAAVTALARQGVKR